MHIFHSGPSAELNESIIQNGPEPALNVSGNPGSNSQATQSAFNFTSVQHEVRIDLLLHLECYAGLQQGQGRDRDACGLGLGVKGRRQKRGMMGAGEELRNKAIGEYIYILRNKAGRIGQRELFTGGNKAG